MQDQRSGLPVDHEKPTKWMEAQPNRTWASVVTLNKKSTNFFFFEQQQKSTIKLRYFPLLIRDSDIVVELPERKVTKKWESCLVGHFLKRNLRFTYVRNYAFNLWKKKGLREVWFTTTGFLFFLFDCVESSSNVVEDGP
ncbi:unnamed protein product [Camellia sinensis]